MKKKILKTKNASSDDSSNSVLTKSDFKSLLNIPNSLTILRIILAPFFMWTILASNYLVAAIILIIGSITDFLDGFLARKLNMQTKIGRLLDPLADKVLIFCCVIALLIKFNFPMWAAIIILSRDVLLFIGGLILISQKKSSSLAPNMLGKVSTFFQMTTLSIFLVFSVFNVNIFISTIALTDLLIYVTVGITIASGVVYVLRVIELYSKKYSKN